MNKLKITWLSDYYDCEQCGGAGADGAKVLLDGKPLLNLVPSASCYGSEYDWSERDVFEQILIKLGYEIEEEYGVADE